MNGCDGFIVSVRYPNAVSCRPTSQDPLAAYRQAVDFRAVAQLVGSVDHDAVARHESGNDLHVIAVGLAQDNLAYRDGIVGIDEVDERARLPALNARRRHRRHVFVGIEQQPDVHELIWEQKLVLVRILRPQFDRSRGGVDLAVGGQQRTVSDLGAAAAIIGVRRQDGSGLDPLRNGLQVVLRHREQDADRLQLGNNNETVGVAWRHVVALVYQAQPDATVQRRQDAAVLQVDLGGLNRRTVGFHRALILRNQSHLRIECLPGHGILRRETLIAGQIDLRALQQGLVPQQISVRLGKGRFVRARVDLRN
jgi:hypothetical protein